MHALKQRLAEQADDSDRPSGQRRTPPPLPPDWRDKLGSWSSRPWSPLIWYFVLLLAMLWFWQEASHQFNTRTIPYSRFKDLVAQHRVTDLAVGQIEITGRALAKPAAPAAGPPRPETSHATTGSRTHGAQIPPAAAAPNAEAPTAAPGQPPSSGTYIFRTVRVDDPDLTKDLQRAGVEYTGVHSSLMTELIWAWVVPIGAMILLWRLVARRMGNMGQGIMSFGSSRAKIVADRATGITFNDVAGCDEAKAELEEVVTFLKNPSRYKSLGASIPKGVLLIGPPGTGKTLLARAVAGEARVPFFLISGSDFVEMFVGVGAARVRSLFEKAKAQAPCIVFIDELDAVGRQRGVHMGPVNDEREQTLNQLLVGMDGFEANVGVIVLAATNRPEVLDRALLRRGRFDRQIVVDAPDLEGRLAVLKLHVRNKPLGPDVELRKVAQQTPGFSGADLANVINEAALLAARRRASQISQKDLEEAADKVVAGPERRSRRLGESEKRQVAYHEVGHALVAAYTKYADPVHKITIIPHGHAALGYTMQVPTEDRYLVSRPALLDRLRGQLGGRAAEEIALGEISTGAENDLQQATALARQMVAMYGMSKVIGLAHCAQRQHPFSGLPDGFIQRDCSEQTAREIDEEVKKLLDQAYLDAKCLLLEHRDQLELVAQQLVERETLDGKAFRNLLGLDGSDSDTARTQPAEPPPAPVRIAAPNTGAAGDQAQAA
jgi:cell division protease FtsH